MTDVDEDVAAAGWTLTSYLVAKGANNLNISGLLDRIEEQMQQTPDRLQWAMNECLANIGIHYPEYRARVIKIGERLAVLKDYPTPPNCTSPYAPVWIEEMVARKRSSNRWMTAKRSSTTGVVSSVVRSGSPSAARSSGL